LWARIFDRFVPWIWACVLLLPLTGYEMIASGLGGFRGIGVYLWLMQLIGWVMILLFLFVFIKFYRKMRRMVLALLIPEAGLCLERIRQVVTINLILGLLGCMVGAGGRYW
jgi:uncharacterized membrane protein